MSTGVVTSVTPRRTGGTLSSDVSASDSVLLVDDAAEFDEDFDTPQFLVIGDETTPREYTAVVNDESGQQSVTLAASVADDYEAGLPVTLWDQDAAAEDKRAIDYQAWVQLDDQAGEPVPASIPHTLIPAAGAAALVGARVRIDEASPLRWVVVDVLGREAQVDAGSVLFPYLALYLSSDTPSLTTGTDTAVSGWSVADSIGFDGPNPEGWVTIPRSGFFRVDAFLPWQDSTSGGRTVYLERRDFEGGALPELRRVIGAPTPNGFMTSHFSEVYPLNEGETIRVGGSQSSGAGLFIRGSADQNRATFKVSWEAAQ